MKRWVLGMLLIVLGSVGLLLQSMGPRFLVLGFGAKSPVATTLAAVLCAAGVIMLSTVANRQASTYALLRLDHFLPFLRKKKKNETLKPPSTLLKLAQCVLPKKWFSDPLTGKPGLFRRTLKRIGPTVLSAPMRRVSQGICFVLFLWLFFYVCWPYDALPEPPGRIDSGWKLDRIVSETGQLHFLKEGNAESLFSANDTIYVIDERAADPVRGQVGAFNVVSSTADRTALVPSQPLNADQLDSFLISGSNWALHERAPWPSHYTDQLAKKEFLPAELFLVIDPLVSLSTALASRSWVWSLTCAAIILLVCVLIPRGFCGYLCPLGTLIDLFDWGISRRVERFRVPSDGWWVHTKYYLLMGTLICSLFGVLVSGYVAAIPVITRAMLFIGDPLQTGTLRGWGQVPALHAGHLISLLLFFGVLGLGFLQPRFWCKYVCPSGAVFSLGNLFRATERKVESSCIHCNKCVEICPFDAIKPDFTTRVTDCTLCQTCAGVCPTQSIKFVERWNLVELKVENDPPTHETSLGRRGFMSLAAGTAAALVGGGALTAVTKSFGAKLGEADCYLPIRPPGSVPEREFLEMCIRCGECFKACPYNVLQPLGFEQGFEGLWTPQVVADHAGCAPSCNACTQVCPTGAIRPIPLEEKRVARMGLAIVNSSTCLPFADKEACQACVDECVAAGYNAIEFTRVHTKVDEDGLPMEGTGYVAPVVLSDKCVGCGLCQMSCYRVNVHQKDLLKESAILVKAGEGKEDRLISGSYVELRTKEEKQRKSEQQQRQKQLPLNDYFAPSDDDDPFGTKK